MLVLLSALILSFFYVNVGATGADTDREKAGYIGLVKKVVIEVN
jgi:hypothetical protein